MSNAQRIKFTIKQDGNVTEEVIGSSGDTCVSLTKDLEDRLGKLENRVYNSDYYKNVSTVDEVVEEWSHDSEGC